MDKFDNRFGFFAPKAPAPQAMPAIASPLLLGDFTKTDGEQVDQPVDPVGAFIKTQSDAALAKNATASDEKLIGLLFAPADSRVPVAPLHKATSFTSSDDWSWSVSVGSLTLEKRTAGTARERFRSQLEKFFTVDGCFHDEEFMEALAVCDDMLDDELEEMKNQTA